MKILSSNIAPAFFTDKASLEAKGGQQRYQAMAFHTIDPITGKVEITIYSDDGNGNGIPMLTLEVDD